MDRFELEERAIGGKRGEDSTIRVIWHRSGAIAHLTNGRRTSKT